MSISEVKLKEQIICQKATEPTLRFSVDLKTKI